MIQWDSRMQNNHGVKVLKAAIPFLDIDVGQKIDFRGLLSAIRPLASAREGHMIDRVLQFFQIQDMLEMVKMFQSMQEENPGEGGESGADFSPFSMFENMPTDMVQMMEMMSMFAPSENKDKEQDEPIDI